MASRHWRLKRRLLRKMSNAQHEQLTAILAEMGFYLARAVAGWPETPHTSRLPLVDLPAFLTGNVAAPIAWDEAGPRSQAQPSLGLPLARIAGTASKTPDAAATITRLKAQRDVRQAAGGV
jgi:hypothetical protein